MRNTSDFVVALLALGSVVAVVVLGSVLAGFAG